MYEKPQYLTPSDCPCSGSYETCADQVVTMAYVPRQNLTCCYEPQVGLNRGTLFPELDKPFFGKQVNCRG